MYSAQVLCLLLHNDVTYLCSYVAYSEPRLHFNNNLQRNYAAELVHVFF